MNYHYVYRITNLVKNKHYYGCRTSKCLPNEDLRIKYFSSSKDKDFIKDQKLNPQNYKYKIIRICSSREEAIKLEIRLHNKFNVGVNESFYNRCKQTSIAWDRVGIPLSKEQKQICSINSKINTPIQWRKYSEEKKKEVCKNISKGLLQYFEALTNEEKQINYINGLGKWKEENPEKMKENWKKAAKKRQGSTNGAARKINIYDSEDKLMFECHGNFINVCEENNLPFNKLKESLRIKKPIYQSAYGKTIAKKYNFEQYIGWIAKYGK